jgi:fatty-acyl-CoA synthase
MSLLFRRTKRIALPSGSLSLDFRFSDFRATQRRLVDADIADVPYDGKTRGEIVAHAPWLTMGYLKDPAGSEQLWAGGYPAHRVVTWDADGTLHIVDRIKDIIKSGGEWVSSIQVEDIISEKSRVVKAAVIAVKDAKRASVRWRS